MSAKKKTTTSATAAARSPQGARIPRWAVLATLALLCLIVFGQTARHPFIAYDDGSFVYENPAVKAGLSGASVTWALTSTVNGYYPLTWLSHMVDVQLWGLDAGGHHATALLLHLLSACLLYLALRRLTGAELPSAVVAALFAIHPTRVESVAWVAERKDTLSTFFGILAIYLYARPRTLRRDLAVASAFAASLLAKQMLVTLPFVLLLLDYWPLRRIDERFRGAGRAIVEKIPLFVLSAAAAVLAVVSQRQMKAIATTGALPLADRLGNALVAYVRYIGKLFWPADLALIYPFEPVPASVAAAAAVVLVALTAALWIYRGKAPWALVGWLWFLGTLVPVIGIIQIGSQSMADRYTYFPYVGLFIAIAFAGWNAIPARAFVAVSAAIVLILTAVAFRQTMLWRSTQDLLEHTIAVTGPNVTAEYTLGQSAELSDPDLAIPHLQRAVELSSGAAGSSASFVSQAHVGLGSAYLVKAQKVGSADERRQLAERAVREYQSAIRLDPSADNARRNLALAESMLPHAAPAAPPAVNVDPMIDEGFRHTQRGEHAEAIAWYRKAVAAAPASVEARVYLAVGLAQAGRNREAAEELRRAQQVDAAKTNRYVTGILQLPKSDENTSRLIAQLEK